jgi:hypothetical protein
LFEKENNIMIYLRFLFAFLASRLVIAQDDYNMDYDIVPTNEYSMSEVDIINLKSYSGGSNYNKNSNNGKSKKKKTMKYLGSGLLGLCCCGCCIGAC